MLEHLHKKESTMNTSIHTHKEQKNSVEVEFSHTTTWNPWLMITVKNNTESIFPLPESMTIHLDGLTITEIDALADDMEQVVSEMREWNNTNKTTENEDIETGVDG